MLRIGVVGAKKRRPKAAYAPPFRGRFGARGAVLSTADNLADHRAGPIGRVVAGPDDVTVGTHEDAARLVGTAPIAIAVAYDLHGHAQRSCRVLERHTTNGACLARKHRLDDTPLEAAEIISRDRRLRSGACITFRQCGPDLDGSLRHTGFEFASAFRRIRKWIVQ